MRKLPAILLALLLICTLASADTAKKTFTLGLTVNGDPTEETNPQWYQLIEGFRAAYPDYDIEVVSYGENSDDYNAQWQMAAAADNLPDMLYASFGYVDDWANVGLLLNVADYKDDSFWSLFVPGAVNFSNQWNLVEGTYGLPTRAESQGWFYNTELFEQCGLEIPTTWEEFMNCVKVFRENGITPIAHGATDIWSIWGYHAMFCNYGLDYEMAQKLQNRELKFADCDAFINTFNRIAELAAAGAYDADVATASEAVALARFAAGEAAMKCSYDIVWKNFNGYLETGESDVANHCVFNFGPKFADGVEDFCGIRMYGWTLMLSSKLAKNDDSREAAMAFLDFFFSEEGTAINQTYMVPAVAFELKDAESMTMVEASTYESYLADIVPVPDSNQAWFDQSIKPTYRNAVTGLICGTLTVDEALAMMQDWADTM